MPINLEECMNLCRECSTTCQETLFNHCLIMGGDHVEPEHIKLMVDCIEICRTSADFMTRNSHMHNYICSACAEICEACAESCLMIGTVEMKRCAEICRRCAQSCRFMGQVSMAA